MPDARLVDAVERIPPASYRGEAFRHVAERWHPLSGAGARLQGGRWNPPNSFATLYLALDDATTVAEFHRMAQRSGLVAEDFVPRRLYRIALGLQAVVDLTAEPADLPDALTELDLEARDLAMSQAVGEAAEHLGREAIRAPSATGSGEILAVFPDRLHPDSKIEPLDFRLWSYPP